MESIVQTFRHLSSRQVQRRSTFVAVAAGTWLLLSSPAGAHVKWFTDFSFALEPRTVSEILTPTFLVLATASIVVFVALVLIDDRLKAMTWYHDVSEWLDALRGHGPAVLRLATAAILLISWENRALLTPELAESSSWVGWFQFVLALLLLAPRASHVAGLGLITLWVVGVYYHGLFHMLDYLHFIGIGFYIFVSRDEERRRGLGLPVLYATVGFALIWLGFEKLVYPEWSQVVLDQNPQILLGLPQDLFLQGSAFVEIGLGFLLLIGLLERPLAALITAVFIATTLIFGRVEVVGHTPLHAALVVFLFAGPGTIYKPPIHIHSKMTWRVAFAVVNFVIVLALFAVGYTAAARQQFNDHAGNPLPAFEIESSEPPAIQQLQLDMDEDGAVTLVLAVDNWTYGAPDVTFDSNTADTTTGFAAIFVDGALVDRAYSSLTYLGDLGQGEHDITVELRNPGNTPYSLDGELISASSSLVGR